MTATRLTRSARPLAVLLAAAATLAAAPAGAEEPADGAAAETPPAGVLLGSFYIRDLRAAEGTKLRLSFDLYAEVDPERAARVRDLLRTHQHRIRNAVLTAVRTCEQREFHDPELERFRRRIDRRLRVMVPELPTQRLLIGEFEFLVG